MDFLGAEIFGAVQSDEDMTSQPLERVKAALHALQNCERLGEHRMK